MRNAMRRLRAFRRDESGAALVEFAIVVALLLIVAFGAFDVGRYYTLRSRVKNAVREGARFGAVFTTELTSDSSSIATYTKARFAGSGSDTIRVSVSWIGSSTSLTDPRRVQVKASGLQFTRLSPIERIASRGISDSAVFRKEQQ